MFWSVGPWEWKDVVLAAHWAEKKGAMLVAPLAVVRAGWKDVVKAVHWAETWGTYFWEWGVAWALVLVRG